MVEESELSNAVKAASDKKWKSTKKETASGLKLVRSIPDTGEGDASLLPPLKNFSSVKVCHDSALERHIFARHCLTFPTA